MASVGPSRRRRLQLHKFLLHAPRRVADNPLLSGILMGQTASTDDSAVNGALTAAMFLFGEFQPNDGVQGLFDALFEDVTPQSRFLSRPPATTFHDVDHFALEGRQQLEPGRHGRSSG